MKRIMFFAVITVFLPAIRNIEAQTPLTPGNIGTATNKTIAWFTPENYSNGTWINRITPAQESETVGNFTQPSGWTTKTPPSTTISNFHPAIMFRPTSYDVAPHRMMSDNMIGIKSDEAFTIILVYKRTLQNSWEYGNILNYGESGHYASYYNVTYYSANSNTLSTGWTTTRRELDAVPSDSLQLLTIDNNNGGTTNSVTNGIKWYLSGAQKGTANTTSGGSASTSSGNDYKIVIGGSHYDLTGNGERSFIGDIQELIILKRTRTTAPFLDDADREKIHSYLAVKYGMTLKGHDYVASNGTVVWNRAANNGYNNHIFGIARDDAYGLYQKQGESVEYPLFTAFVGNDVTALNSANTSGRLDNGVYVMFGDNNAPDTYTEEQYTVPGSTRTLNYRKNLAYKVQITDAPSVKVKFKPSNNSAARAAPEYMLISSNPNFPPNDTEVLPFRSSVVEKDLPNGYYISFGGNMTIANQGPGGEAGGLMLWLRADDEATVATEILLTGDAKLANYPGTTQTGIPVSAMSAWKDLVRNHTYSYADGHTESSAPAAHLEPVYQQNNFMMNFHPAVQFWGTGNTNATWLGNTNGIWPSAHPTGDKHSAFFVVNNNFSTNNWVYTLMFGSATANSYRGPGYGVEKRTGNNIVVGRIRTDTDIDAGEGFGYGTVDLFKPGATSILGYHHHLWGKSSSPQTGENTVKFRFNGLEDQATTRYSSSFGLNQPSMIGKGYTHDRSIMGVMSEIIMYDGELSTGKMQRIESYLALKYGITLTPGNLSGRFDYLFSDGTMLWNGTAGTGTKWDTYYNRIAAVIRDDEANLENRQSHSTNVGSILHIGVAGSRLGTHVDVGTFEYDKEAVIWGDDNKGGTTTVHPEEACGDFTSIFNRTWRIHKVTRDDRPVHLLVGAENNSGNQLGQVAHGASQADTALINKLKEGFDVSLIIADDPRKLDPNDAIYDGNFKAVVPMTYMDGEHQCAYTFTDTVVYVTFGYKENRDGCASTVEFDGAKTFDWSQWTRSSSISLTQGFKDLGDGVRVEGTSVAYESGVNPPAYYPSVINSPTEGSLYVRRQRGALDSKVTIIINFNTPVRPEFSLYDIDGYLSAFERVTVTGECAGGTMIPDLSYAGSPSSSSYKINSNVATATAARALSPTDKNGQVNVSFREGVKKIIIEYAITNRIPPTWQINDLIISPIRLRQIPPPPPLNEDGLSFVKDVKSREITTCDPVEYTFYIQNVNCDPKYVHFRDTLPDKMKWEDGLGMDSINAYENTHIRFNSYEGNAILHIDSLLVPGAGTLILTATAILDKDAVPQGDTVRFDNHARIKYKQWVENVELDRELKSVDRETLAEETWFEAAWSIRQETIPTDITVDKDYYNADSERTVTITLDNPSDDPITDSYLDLLFDAGFTYVANSFESSIISSPAPVAVTSATDSTLLIAGVTSGASGFTIPPSGTSTFKFKLRAPAAANLVHAIDENNQETNDIADLNIEYLFISEMDDPCIIRSMTDMSGSKQVPYRWASDDDTTTIPGKPIKIPVLDNDSIPTGCTPTVKITEGPKIAGATATVVNDSILYFPGNDCVGDRFDTLIYRARCTNSIDSSWAYVYIKIDKAPDVYPAGDISIITSGNSLIVAIGIVNKGDSAIGPPVHMTLYKEKVAPENKITGGSASYDIKIAPDDTSYISITIPNDTITKHAIAHIVARINDNDGAFPYWEECDTTNNKISMVNTLLNESMKKNAFPKGSLTTQNGAYSNPVSILFGDTIEYQIMVENPVDEDIVICDTLPPYMNYVDGSANPPPDVNPPLKTAGNPQRTILSWTLTNIRPPRPNNLAEITFEATPALGSNASQPLYINQAWVTVDNTIVVPTSSTYHQGTGTCTVTFSTGHGGSIYNADPQVIDYSTSANAGVLVAPDEGHRFIGWSYDDYVSYRGELIKGGSGVIHYDTLAVFGNVELRANFELNNYPIRYHLNEGINAESNPETYTVKSGTITLEAPRKAGDEFVGWTGSNGEELQKTVTIPVGSTGEREYYANFMYSGREDGVQDMPTDKIWSAGNEVYIRTSQTGSVVRIYTPDGILRKQHTILSSGITKFKLDPGVYILTLNNSVGQKVVINQ